MTIAGEMLNLTPTRMALLGHHVNRLRAASRRRLQVGPPRSPSIGIHACAKSGMPVRVSRSVTKRDVTCYALFPVTRSWRNFEDLEATNSLQLRSRSLELLTLMEKVWVHFDCEQQFLNFGQSHPSARIAQKHLQIKFGRSNLAIPSLCIR